jgi:hypothetical protein
LAFAAFAFAPQAIEYGRVLKQYGGDIAVAATLLYIAQRRRNWLVIAVPLAPFFSYPAIFLAPGLILLAPRKYWTAGLTACSALLIYFAFIQPNQSDALRAHWSIELHGMRHIASLFAGSPVLFFCAGPSLFLIRRRLRIALCLSVLPLLLAIAAERLGLYPVVPRTALFLLPSLSLALAGSIWAILMRLNRFHFAANPILLAACAWICVQGFRAAPPVLTVEHLDEAFTELYSRYQPGDTIYVHASVSEGFRLYSRVRGLDAQKVLWGNTSAACCPRGRSHPRGATKQSDVQADLNRLFPANPKGRLWTVWTDRQEHWIWIDFDDRQLIADYLSNQGCKTKPTIPFGSVGLNLYSCNE